MQIRWTESAVEDLTRICDYIEQRGSAASARKVAISIHLAVDSLADFPERGRTGRKSGTRELVFYNLPYLAVYRVITDGIEILRILHGAQQWPE